MFSQRCPSLFLCFFAGAIPFALVLLLYIRRKCAFNNAIALSTYALSVYVRLRLETAQQFVHKVVYLIKVRNSFNNPIVYANRYVRTLATERY